MKLKPPLESRRVRTQPWRRTFLPTDSGRRAWRTLIDSMMGILNTASFTGAGRNPSITDFHPAGYAILRRTQSRPPPTRTERGPKDRCRQTRPQSEVEPAPRPVHGTAGQDG